MSTSKVLEINDLPSPKGDFILGHLRQFKRLPEHQVLESWINECGPVFKVHFMGKQFLICADESINKQILSLRPHKFRRFTLVNIILREMGIDSVFNAEGDNWKRHRAPVNDAMNVKRLNQYYAVLQEKALKTLENFNAYADRGEIRDIKKDFMSFSIDAITSIAFGYNLNLIHREKHEFQEHLDNIFKITNERLTAPFPTWRYFKRKKDKSFDRSLAIVKSTIYEFIQQAKEKLKTDPQLRQSPSNFLEALLIDTEAQFSDHEIYGNLFTMLLAGEETTSNTLSWATFYLAQKPSVVKRIREEAIEVYGQKVIPDTRQCLSKLSYTNAVVQEALRLKSTIPQLYLESIDDIQLDNLRIRRNTPIMVQTGAAQKRNGYFSDADNFCPERWLDNARAENKNHSPSVLKAFGGGPRFCPGKMLATDEMLLLLSMLCKHFDFTLNVDPKDIEEQFVFTMSPVNLLVKLHHPVVQNIV